MFISNDVINTHDPAMQYVGASLVGLVVLSFLVGPLLLWAITSVYRAAASSSYDQTDRWVAAAAVVLLLVVVAADVLVFQNFNDPSSDAHPAQMLVRKLATGVGLVAGVAGPALYVWNYARPGWMY